MKLCIVRQDNTIAEIPMGERPPIIESVNNDLLFLENYQYRLILRDNVACENVEVFIGDYQIPVHYKGESDCYESDLDLIFGGCFDLAYISVCITDELGEEQSFFTDFLRVATTKQTAKKVEQMLEEIERNLPNFLEVCFSKNKKKSGLIKNDIRSIWNTLKIIDEIIGIYEANIGYFRNHKKAVTEPVATVVDAKSMRALDQECLRWIACNPDNLVCTDKDTGITYEEKKYMPSKIKTYISRYSYDVYENRVILGFIKCVINFIDVQISGFAKEMLALEVVPDVIVAQLPNTHELTGRCVYIYYRGITERFKERRTKLQELFYKYEKLLECKPEELYGIPNLTNTFKQVYHYRVCYECMVKWYDAGDYSFEHLNYLFKLKTLSRIFEYFCLIKIQKAIAQCGYLFRESDRIVYDAEDDLGEINNLYVFEGTNYKITLLYEPSIWVDKNNAGTNLYSTGYNFSKSKWNDRWTPDFIIKIACGSRDYYYILDAKYSNATNVKKRYLPELVLKYGAQIASKDKFFSDVIGIGAIYPADDDKFTLFKKNAVGSSKPSLPKYFSMSMVGETVGDNIIKRRLSELLDTIDVLESVESTINDKIRSMENIGNQAKDEHVEVRVENNPESGVAENAEDKNIKKSDIVTMVNGKKCYYYGKSLCMLKKIRCNATEQPCNDFVSKLSKPLIENEDTCRNFIRYTRRGQVKRVECSVSGLPGCVGPDICKFCMKKNKKK